MTRLVVCLFLLCASTTLAFAQHEHDSSTAPASPICARTASAATGSAAASDARSHSPAKAAAGEWPSVPVFRQKERLQRFSI